MIEVWQDKFVLAADPGGVEYDAVQIDELMAARFKERRAEAALDASASRNAVAALNHSSLTISEPCGVL